MWSAVLSAQTALSLLGRLSGKRTCVCASVCACAVRTTNTLPHTVHTLRDQHKKKNCRPLNVHTCSCMRACVRVLNNFSHQHRSTSPVVARAPDVDKFVPCTRAQKYRTHKYARGRTHAPTGACTHAHLCTHITTPLNAPIGGLRQPHSNRPLLSPPPPPFEQSPASSASERFRSNTFFFLSALGQTHTHTRSACANIAKLSRSELTRFSRATRPHGMHVFSVLAQARSFCTCIHSAVTCCGAINTFCRDATPGLATAAAPQRSESD